MKFKVSELEGDLSEALTKARDYVECSKKSVEKLKERNQFHLMPEVGWMNDPNGFSVYRGEYHLFYQYYPYDVIWGPMHWGHAKSKDLIKWEYMPVALAPDQVYDADGCFSGSAIEVKGKHILMYTGHVNPDSTDETNVRQVQCLAVGDGVDYKKLKNNPVIDTAQIPAHGNPSDFRDPKIWEKDGQYFCVLGSKTRDHDGQLLLYKSKNLIHWNYVGIMSQSHKQLGYMWECPDVFHLEGQDVIIMSPQGVKEERYRHKNSNTTVYVLGTLNEETAHFEQEAMDEMDYGLDFYAPQTTLTPDGRRVMVAWMQSWHQNIPTDVLGWVSSMTIPRELTIMKGRLHQNPVKELENYRHHLVTYDDVHFRGDLELEDVIGRQVDIELSVDLSHTPFFEIQLMKGINQVTKISYDVKQEVLTFNREKGGSHIEGVNERQMPVALQERILKLRVVMDTYSVEIFAQDGAYAMTSTVYADLESDQISFHSKDMTTLSIKKWELRS